MLLHLHSRDLRTAVAAAAVAGASKPPWSGGGGGGGRRSSCRPFSARADPPFPRPLTASSPKTSAAAASPETAAVKVETKPPVCTADELHYAPVPGTEWRLALWRYMPSPEVFDPIPALEASGSLILLFRLFGSDLDWILFDLMGFCV